MEVIKLNFEVKYLNIELKEIWRYMCNNLEKKMIKKICLFEGLLLIGFSFIIYNVFGDDLVNLKIYLNVKRFLWIWVKEN